MLEHISVVTVSECLAAGERLLFLGPSMSDWPRGERPPLDEPRLLLEKKKSKDVEFNSGSTDFKITEIV